MTDIPIPATTRPHMLRSLSANPLGIFALCLLGALIVVCLLAPLIAPFPPSAVRINMVNAPPGVSLPPL